ncbi:DUF3263 domain-containing protein [Propionicimonas sp.]|uniref:DUF3263 domain-containing protein n=1 Tax=Propionicimonas sp. TaxID=1955623 RepID=UPI0039E6B939
MTTPTAKILLDAALSQDWPALRVTTGISAPRLTQMARGLLDDPEVIAQCPVECAQLRRRRDAVREFRSSRLGV